jgi:hypothetical protein
MDPGITILAIAMTATVGVLFGIAVRAHERIQVAVVVLAPCAAALVMFVAEGVQYALLPDGQDWSLALNYWPVYCCLDLVAGLPAAVACVGTQWLLLWSRSGNMKVAKALAIIPGCTAICGGGGCLIGYLLGTYVPGYYRAVFSNGNSPTFNPVSVGIGLGLTQGLTVGLIIGCVVVLAVAIRTPRHSLPIIRQDAGSHFGMQGGKDPEPSSLGVQEDVARIQSRSPE